MENFRRFENAKRFGGLQSESSGEEDEEESQGSSAVLIERERKKAEVRKRLEEAGRMKKAKKGFLTPERKKKLRKLLMLKATEDLKLQQEIRAEERQRILNERILSLPEGIDVCNQEDLLELGKTFCARIMALESEIYDLNYIVRQKDFEINELTIAVNDLRGKFVKPTLKRISKTETQFDKIKKINAAKVDFRATLKTVEHQKFAMEEEKVHEKSAEWAK
uniref:Troponin I n=1 Tax=Ditylenchus dipsaci TaxID=166011 RepID=A0A915CRZ8_9BILA